MFTYIMSESYRKLEILIDKLVPYSLGFVIIHFILLFIIPDVLHEYEDLILVLEVFLVTVVLGLDVTFKYRRARDKKNFFKQHWLEVIAVFPFMVVFRVFEEFYLITRFIPLEGTLVETQTVLHELRGADAAADIVRESQFAGRASRIGMFNKMFRPIARLPRLLRGASFYEHPLTKNNKKHHKIHYLFYSKHAKKALKVR